MNNDNLNQYNVEEINLMRIFKLFLEHSRFIFGFTGVVTLIAIGYVLSLTSPPSQYKIESSIVRPSEVSVIKLNQYSLLDETADTIFSKFLTNLNSQELKREVFIDGGYLKRLQKEDELIVDIDNYITKFIDSITISLSKAVSTKKPAKYLTQFEIPYILSGESSNPDIFTGFLNDVLTRADNKTINSFINIQKLKIATRLNEITTERRLILTKSKQDRLSQIKRIKEADTQTLREINDKIDSARFIAAQERMNKIALLTNSAQLAATLGIIDNNLSLFNKGSSNTNLNIAIQSGTNIPDWYLFGETVLLEMIASLEARKNDDPYIPQLALLINQIKEIQKNSLLQSLEERLDDSPFIAQINQLDVETIKLKSISLDSTGINAMRLYQPAMSQIIPTKNMNRYIIVMTFISSFILSLVLVFLMNALKEEDIISVQKGK